MGYQRRVHGVVYSRFSLSKHQHEIDSRDCSPCGCCPLGASTRGKTMVRMGMGMAILWLRLWKEVSRRGTRSKCWYYGGYGWPYYGGYHWYGKRSADAEPTPNADAKAEPWYGWGYGWPYYGGYYGYGKRSADAEPAPNADAKPEPWYYGSYGYGWPHYGYYWG